MRIAASFVALAAACADLPNYPQVINVDEGPVLTSPRVVPVFWGEDAIVVSVEDFLRKLGGSRYWEQVTAEYGVGPARFDASVFVSDPPPETLTFDGIRSFITDSIASGVFPPADDQTIYALMYPSATHADGGCNQFFGYHEEIVQPGDVSIVYAIVLRCPPTFDLNELDVATSVLSHELIEASTDPYVRTQRAYGGVTSDFRYWAMRAGGTELTDMCGVAGRARLQRYVGPYLVQRSWSNREAAAGRNPCVPVP